MIKMEEGMMQKFEEEIRALINRNSMENTSNTPDFVLAQFVTTCLNALNIAVQQRETYYGRDSRPSPSSEVGEENTIICLCGTPEYCSRHPWSKPKDSSVDCPPHGMKDCPTCSIHSPVEKPKDSEVWCECLVPAAFPKCICSNCHKTVDVVNPHYVPFKTLKQKFIDIIKKFAYSKSDLGGKNYLISMQEVDEMTDIAHEHFKQV